MNRSFPVIRGRANLVYGVVYGVAQLIRLPVSLLAGLAGWGAVYALDATLPLTRYFLVATILTCMTAASCTINDFWDVEKDRVNHPDRPLPSGRLPLAVAWWVAVALFAVAGLAATELGLNVLILVAVSTVLLWHYSRLLQYSGILGNLLVATVIALLILLAGLVVGQPLAMLYPTGFLFVYALTREIVLDIHDAEGDRRQGVITIANGWGDRPAFTIAWGLLGGLLVSLTVGFAFPIMLHPFWFASFASLLLLSLAIPLLIYQHDRTETAYARIIFWERLGMLLGIVALFGATPRL